MPPDRFEVVADDTLFTVDLQSALALCIYDAVDEAGALLHLRFISRGSQPADATDTTLATELLLLDRCVSRCARSRPGARALQAKIAAHLPEGRTPGVPDSVLTLVRHFLADVDIAEVSSDVAGGRAAHAALSAEHGQLQIS